MARLNGKLALSVMTVALLSSCAHAPQPALPSVTVFDQTMTLADWIQQTEQQAVAGGLSPATVHAALDNFAPNPRVIALDQKQPESTVSFDTYRRNTVTPARIRKGAELMRDYAVILSDIEARTGVPPEIVMALWGIESSYGQNQGDFETVNALATLAYQGRRADLFRKELFAALRILDQEHLDPSQLRGSWAGAMGQCQFMPSTYLGYAVDGDADGRRDIWRSPVDVMASIATYLAAEGWQRGMGWGQEVDPDTVPARMPLTQPDGAGGVSFRTTDNFHAIMRWNRSTYFALSVGLLADAIKAQN